MPISMTEKEFAKLTSAKAKRPTCQRTADSSRQYTLDCLARSGYTLYCYDHRTGEHWFRNIRTGATSPRQPDYDAAIDAAKEG